MATNGTMMRYEGPRKQVVWNPISRRFETVHPEDEVPRQHRITVYWHAPARRYVSIPE